MIDNQQHGDRLSRDQALKQRAKVVIPGGMYGHQSTWQLPADYPQFFSRGEAGHVWDSDGNEYIDFMSSYGPIILGHRHRAVEQAVAKQLASGDCFNGPSPVIVELAEQLCDQVSHADWNLFAKNGTDATTLCVSIARAYNNKRKILVASNAYHGAAPWCTPVPTGTTDSDRVHLIHYQFNDIPSLEAAITLAGEDLAGILVSAFQHDNVVDQQMPELAFAQYLRRRCDELDAALIVDEVRAGLRLHRGASWELLGVEPDLSAWSKAIANGYALASVMGSEKYRKAARSVFSTGSFWFTAAAMAAAQATLRVIDSEQVIERISALGETFRAGLDRQADSYSIGISQSGPAQIPLILFKDDSKDNKERGNFFCNEAIKLGLYLHPKHNMFFNGGHNEQDISQALDICDQAFKALKMHYY